MMLEKGLTMQYRLPALYRPRGEASLYRNKSGYFKGRKFYKHCRPNQANKGGEVEAIRPNSILTGQLTFTNLSSDLLGLLFYSMGLTGSIQLKLGGGKPAGLGSTCIEPAKLIFHLGREAFLNHSCNEKAITMLDGELLIAEVNRCIGSARKNDFILTPQAEKIEKLLRYDEKVLEECPLGAY